MSYQDDHKLVGSIPPIITLSDRSRPISMEVDMDDIGDSDSDIDDEDNDLWLKSKSEVSHSGVQTKDSGKSVAASKQLRRRKLTQDASGNESRGRQNRHQTRATQALSKSGLGLTEPPDVEEWLDAKYIDLSHNELSNLPEDPVCPNLFLLYLQGNYKLRKIPPAFFANMPLLRTLNLSETGIMSLPTSLFELPCLVSLYLEKCEFLMVLPPEVGKLKRLEVLHMKGTEIINLPIEIKKISVLRRLEITLYGCLDHDWKHRQLNEMIPSGVISALPKLEAIHIDVNPDDERWDDKCVERILKEVCGLRSLRNFEFYFPRVELLRCLKPDWASGSQFNLIVGGHSKRIISRLPRSVEFEVEMRHRSLKYINGEGAPEDIKKVLKYAATFHLDRHMTVKKLTEFGIENMELLKCCVLGECNEIQVIIDGNDIHEEDANSQIKCEPSGDKRIGLESLEFLCIYYMKNLKSIWEGPVHKRCLFHLKKLILSTCPKLTTIFTVELLENLQNLEEISVRQCRSIKSLVSCEEGVKQSENYLPKLRTISLHYLPELVSISSEVWFAPELWTMSLYNCPKLKSLFIKEVSYAKLWSITGERDWWEALEWTTQLQHDKLDRIFSPINPNTCFE